MPLRRSCLFAVWLCALSSVFGQSANYPYILKRLAGATVPLGDGGPAVSASLIQPWAVAEDGSGNVFVMDHGHAKIREIDTSGNIHTFVTLPGAGWDIKFGVDGNLYVSGTGWVWKITPAGVITPIAGNGTQAYGGDGQPALSAQVGLVESLALDSSLDIFLADYSNNRVRKITPDGKIQTIAGNGTAAFNGDQSSATAAQLNPFGIAVDAAGNVFVTDSSNVRVRKINTQGAIQTICGSGAIGNEKDGVATQSPLSAPVGIAVDNAGNVYFTDSTNINVTPVYEITVSGNVVYLAGGTTGVDAANGSAANSVLFGAIHLAFDSTGSILYAADSVSNLVHSLILPSTLQTIAGVLHYTGDGQQATAATLNLPFGMAFDNQANLLIADTDNYVIRKVNSNGIISTYAGSGLPGFPTDGTVLLKGPLLKVRGIVTDSSGNADLAMAEKLEQLTAGATFQTLAGTGAQGLGIDNGSALLTASGILGGVARDASGNLYLTDWSFNRIRQVSAATGTITNFAGSSAGKAGFSGDTHAATSALFNFSGVVQNEIVPLTFDSQGNLYVADAGNNRIRMISANGVVNTVVGNGTYGPPVDGKLATQTPFSSGGGIAVDAAGNLYVSDYNFAAVYKVNANGIINRIAGGGTQAAADGMDARLAASVANTAVLVDANGDLYSSNSFDSIWKLILNSPTGLTIGGGNNQSGAAGSALPSGLSVVVNGRAGVGVSGVTVTFSVTSGSATLSSSSVQTDSTGAASATLTLGSSPGPVTVTASVAGSSVAAVQFNETATAAAGCSIGLPHISSVNYATDFGGFAGFSSGAYLEVKGTNLALDARQWAGTDFSGSNAPTILDGSEVAINGIPGYVSYISGQQINVQAPADPSTGPVPIVVTNCAGSSNSVTLTKNPVEPGMLAPASFNVGKQYLVALFANDLAQGLVTFVGNTGLIAGANFRPARPGDAVAVYGLGFGQVSPSTPPGVIASGSTSLTGLSISFGSTPAAVSYAGLYPGFVGLYEFFVTVPAVPSGDSQINVSINGAAVPQTLFLTVQQ